MTVRPRSHRLLHVLAVSLLTFAAPASAQVFSSESLRGSLIGGVIGGIVGHNSNRRAAEGMAVGAGAGWLLGSMTRERGNNDTYIPSRSQSRYADAPFGTHRPHHALTGAAVGAVAGGAIGHNSGGRTMEGVGIGAASGGVIGGLVEHAQRRRANQHYFAQEARPGRSTAFHANPPPAKATAFPRAIHMREIRDGAIVTTSAPALETGSTLLQRIPDRTRASGKTTRKRPVVKFEYLGKPPKK